MTALNSGSGPAGCPEWLLIGKLQDKLLKTTLAATASTATSNVSSSCAYRTMGQVKYTIISL